MTNTARIFLVEEGTHALTGLIESAYDTEDVLQDALARFPDLLPGDQIDPENPRRWLLVRREMEVPDTTDGGGRWSLDHLFLDQDAVPTFIECKRATDTRIRREVVAQMLDYAANGAEYWTVARLRQAAAQTHGEALDEEVRRLLGADEPDDIEPFWKAVEENLRRGRLRLIFAADNLPKELRRLVEFMNAKMADVEVLALEIKQFVADGRKVLVPRMLGVSEAVRDRKSAGTVSPVAATTRDAFLNRCDEVARAFFVELLDQSAQAGRHVAWGRNGFSIRAALGEAGRLTSFAYGSPPGVATTAPHAVFDIYLGYLPLTNADALALRGRVLSSASGALRLTGKHTLRGALTEATVDGAREAWQTMLAAIAQIAQDPGPVRDDAASSAPDA